MEHKWECLPTTAMPWVNSFPWPDSKCWLSLLLILLLTLRHLVDVQQVPSLILIIVIITLRGSSTLCIVKNYWDSNNCTCKESVVVWLVSGLISWAWLQHFFSSITMFRKLFAFPFKPLFNAAKFLVRIHLSKQNKK